MILLTDMREYTCCLIGILLLLIVVIALISDIKRRRLRRSLDHEMNSAREMGEVQFYRDINKNIDHFKDNLNLKSIDERLGAVL